MNISCIVDVASREVSFQENYKIASYDHNVDVIHFSVEPIEDFSLDTSSIKIAAQGPNKARHDYAVDPSTVQIEEETGYITFDWPIPAGVTEMPIGTFKYGDKGNLIFSVCAEIIDGSTVSKAWHSDDGIITVVAHLEPESGGGEDPSETATNAQKIAQLQTNVAVINTQVGALANGSPTPVATVAEMTDESAVYLYTGSEAGYTAGNWYYYDGTAWTSGGAYGGAYGGAVTDSTLSIEGAAADAKAVGDALALKADADDVGDLSQLTTTAKNNLVSSINETDGAITEINERLTQEIEDVKEELYSTRNILDATYDPRTTTASFNCVSSEIMYPTKTYNIHIECDTILSANCAVYFRNARSGNLNYLGNFLLGETEHDFLSVSPSAECTIIRLSRGMIGAVYSISIDENVSNIDDMKNDIDANERSISNITQKTPIENFGAFSNAYWRNEDTFATIAYRVGCGTTIVFAKDVVLSCYGEFFICGYIGSNAFSPTSTMTIPANTPLKLYIRRIWENTEEQASISEFTSSVYILDYSDASEYNLLSYSFAGIEMFRTAGFIGDSYTAKRLGLSWVDIVANKTGVIATKYAKSGDDAGAWISDAVNGLPVLLNDTPKDLYWIALGINDGQRVDNDPSYLGSVSDLSGDYESYPDTFWGNMGHIIEAIKTHAPKAKIVLYKPIYRGIWRTLGGTAADKDGVESVRNAIGNIANHYELPYIDALDDVFFHSDWYAKHMDYDIDSGNHPSLLLYPGIANANMRLFSRCVMDNPDMFMGLYYTN